MTENALIIFTKNLIDGRVKARLADALGNDVAKLIHKHHQMLIKLFLMLIGYEMIFGNIICFKKKCRKEMIGVKRMKNALNSLSADQAGPVYCRV